PRMEGNVHQARVHRTGVDLGQAGDRLWIEDAFSDDSKTPGPLRDEDVPVRQNCQRPGILQTLDWHHPVRVPLAGEDLRGGRQGIGGSGRHGGRGILAADDRPERYERETEDGETRLHERLLVSMSAGKRGVRASRARPGELSYDCRANASRARIVTPVRPAGV